jgi:hypothetical protein
MAQPRRNERSKMDSSIISSLRPIFELLYFASGVGLLIVGLFALRQISLAKTNILVRSSREAAAIAASQCERYHKDIIPLWDKFDLIRAERGIPDYNLTIGDFTLEHVHDLGEAWPCKWLTKMNDREFAALCVETFNALESFAVYFTEGVGNERIAFESVGKTFCNNVVQCYPMVAVVRRRGGSNYYNNIVKLFELWYPRLAGEELRGQLQEITTRLSLLEHKCVEPLGTKL